MSTRYQFEFAWNSPYGHAVRLLETLDVHGGLVLDLGCGFGPVAAPVKHLGFDYLGVDREGAALDSMRAAGLACQELDLTEYASLPDRLHALAAGRPVRAVLLLDTLEHLPDTGAFLDALRSASERIGRPVLIVSVPNVSHFNVGAKLALGRWDVRPSGLLDSTHLQHFTAARLIESLQHHGWAQIASNDFILHHSDQNFPSDHPVLRDGAPLRDFLWHLRGRVNDTATVNQFVRAFAPMAVGLRASPAPEPGCFLSVLLRTQGRRWLGLRDALTCLAAQTHDDFEVQVLVHTPDEDTVTRIRELVGCFAPEFNHRVRVHPVREGGRARPLNVGLREAAGRYVAFLDDDDFVTADWVDTFRAGATAAPGRVVRSMAADRRVMRPEPTHLSAPFVARSGLTLSHAPSFDFVQHLLINQTPICSFAVPVATLREMNIEFQEDLAVVEDWDFLLRAAMLAGVHDTHLATSVYHRWVGAESSLETIPSGVWNLTRRTVLQRLDAAPLLLPKGSATRLGDHLENTAIERERLEGQVERLRGELAEARALACDLDEQLGHTRWALDRIQNSEFWRATAPLRRTIDAIRGAFRRTKPDPVEPEAPDRNASPPDESAS